MTADRDQHGMTRADLAIALAQPDEWQPRLGPPAEPASFHDACGWSGNKGQPCDCDGLPGDTQ